MSELNQKNDCLDTQPVVSICCVCYNHEPYIKQALDGFLMQKTNFPIEIIVFDDASTDNTQDIIREYADKYPHLFRLFLQKQNIWQRTGISGTVSIVFPNVKGKYIAMCEGDDYWTDAYKLQKQVDFMETHPNCGLLHTNYRHYWQAIDTFIDVNKSVNQGCIFDQLILNNQITTLTVLIRVDLIQEFISHKDLTTSPLVMDYFWWLFVAERAEINFLEDSTGVYRSLPESASNTWDERKKRAFEATVMDIKIFYAQRNNKMYLIEKQVEDYHKNMLLYAFYSQNSVLLQKSYKYLLEHNTVSFQDYLINKSHNNKLLTILTKLYIKSKKLTKSK